MDNSIFKSLEKINQLLNKAKDPKSQKEWIKKCETTHFPAVVLKTIKEELSIQTIEEIPNVLYKLYQLRKFGINFIWDDVHEIIKYRAKKQCGQIFPDSSIEEGRNLLLDFEYLSLYVAHTITFLDLNKNLLNEISLAISVANNPSEEKFQAYFDANPSYIINLPKSHHEDSFNLSDSLNELGKSMEQLSCSTLDLLKIVTPPAYQKQYASIPNFFNDNPGQQGCEHIPGSYFDELGRVIPPNFNR